jgi:hypothetical protein
MYEYMTGMGTQAFTDSGIQLGPGVPVPPDSGIILGAPTSVGPDPGIILGPPESLPSGGMVSPELTVFVDELKAEKGPFVYLDKDSPSGMEFVQWLMAYDQGYMDWFMKIMALKLSKDLFMAEGVVLPEWLEGNTLRFKQELYNLYVASMNRVRALVAAGTTMPALADMEPFLRWWAEVDRAGFAAFIVQNAEAGATPTALPVPAELFAFAKSTQWKGVPSNAMLGLDHPLWAGIKNNWFWILGGVVGGAVAAKAWRNRQEKKAVERLGKAKTVPAETMVEVPRRNKTPCKNCW